jgi:plasmid maintenance system killer protein
MVKLSKEYVNEYNLDIKNQIFDISADDKDLYINSYPYKLLGNELCFNNLVYINDQFRIIYNREKIPSNLYMEYIQ